MNKERLLRLASRMDKVQQDHFDIGSWFDANTAATEYSGGSLIKEKSVVEEVEPDLVKLIEPNFCGSTACVLGHAAQIKEFKQAGLHLVIRKDRHWNFTLGAYGEEFDYTGDGSVFLYGENGEQAEGNEAGAIFFDIPDGHARVMFATGGPGSATDAFYGADDDGNITPGAVANALRLYVQTNGQSLLDVVRGEVGWWDADEETGELSPWYAGERAEYEATSYQG